MSKIEELENKIKEYEKGLEEFQKELDELKKEKQPVKRWRAEEYKSYYFITATKVQEYNENKDNIDNCLYNMGNYFQTESQAEEYQEKLLIYQELKDLALELNNGGKIDWKDLEQFKYYIMFDYHDNSLCLGWTYGIRDIGQIYCLDEDFLDIAKKRIGEDRLLKLFKGE